jgi:hypothetical protein
MSRAFTFGDWLDRIRQICEAFDSEPSIRKAVVAARKRARALQGKRGGRIKRLSRKQR